MKYGLEVFIFILIAIISSISFLEGKMSQTDKNSKYPKMLKVVTGELLTCETDKEIMADIIKELDRGCGK